MTPHCTRAAAKQASLCQRDGLSVIKSASRCMIYLHRFALLAAESYPLSDVFCLVAQVFAFMPGACPEVARSLHAALSQCIALAMPVHTIARAQCPSV